ncbi:hypothetical protein ACXJJ3_41345 [Kribbella sp. WER1]
MTTSAYLDRLGRSATFDSWLTTELSEALASLDTELTERSRSPDGGPRVINIRLQIYRQRLQRELDQRAARHGE